MKFSNYLTPHRVMPDINDYRSALGKHCSEVGVGAAARAFNVSYPLAVYWYHKYLNPEFHGNTYGGHRWCKFSERDRYILEARLWQTAKEHPCWRIQDFVEDLILAGFSVNREFVRRIFKTWRWSWKRADPKQPHKYTLENMNYTIDFVLWIRTVPLDKVKFLDESHFNSKGMELNLFKSISSVKLTCNFRLSVQTTAYWPNDTKTNCQSHARNDRILFCHAFDLSITRCKKSL